MSKERLSDKHSVSSNEELDDLRSLVGQLNWASTQTRPDMAYVTSMIGSSIKNGTVEDLLLKTNKSVKKMQAEQVSINFQRIGKITETKFVGFADAAFGDLKGNESQGGLIIFLVGKNGKFSPITWKLKKIKPIVKSILAAKTLFLEDHSEVHFFLQTLFCEMLNIDIKDIPINIITCSHQLHDTIFSTNTLKDKWLMVDSCLMRNMLSSKEISGITWVDSQSQLADCLTKSSSRAKLLTVLSGKGTLI